MLILGMNMANPAAIKFWYSQFVTDALLEEVPWSVLEGMPFLQRVSPEKRARLKNLFCVEWNDHTKRVPIVSMKHLDLLVSWFGNFFDPACGPAILEEMQGLLEEEWFHWDVTTAVQAQRRLMGRAFRSFLIRVSFANPSSNPFTLSIAGERDHV
jgi:hypothetical protein